MIQNHENLSGDGGASPESSPTPASGDPLSLKIPAPTHEQTLEFGNLACDPDWEVIDEGGNVVPPGVFDDAREAIDAEVISVSPFTGTQAPSPSASSDDGDREQVYAPLPEDDKVSPTPARKPVRRRNAKRTRRQPTRPAWQPGLDQRFLELLAERTASGARFSPSAAGPLSSSVQQSGERISAQVVKHALEYIQTSYHPEESSFNRVRIPRVKHLAIRICEILAVQDLVHPCVRNYEFMSEAFTALRGIEAALKRCSEQYDE